jgi:peptidoglycan/LPS O-acetylase OafA/YrhL
MVVLYHYLQQFWGTAFLILPDGFTANWQRLQIFQGGGLLNWFNNVFAGLFAYGFGAVNVFLVLSGFLLTWSLLQKKSENRSWGKVLLKRMKRILIPFYISVLIGILCLCFRNYFFPQYLWWPDYHLPDYLKFIIPPFLLFDQKWLQQLDGVYWYIPLILQLYLIFPLLFIWLKKRGAVKFLAGTLALTVLYRFLATYGYNLLLPWINVPFLDGAPMGVVSPSQNSYYGFSFFWPRLFEFSLGMALAFGEFNKPGWIKKISGGWQFLAFAGLTFTGFSLNYFRPGWLLSDSLIAFGLFGLFYNLSAIIQNLRPADRILKFISESTYETYLLHHYFLNLVFWPMLISLGLKNETGFWTGLPVYFLSVLLLGRFGLLLSQLTEKKLLP